MIKSLNSRLASLETVIKQRENRQEPYLIFLSDPWDIAICSDSASAWAAIDKYRGRITDVNGPDAARMLRRINDIEIT